jgi:hypothetical protein
LVGKKFLIYSYEVCFKLLDKGFIELVGPKNLTAFFYKLAFNLRTQQTGFVYQYISVMVISFIFIYLNFDLFSTL